MDTNQVNELKYSDLRPWGVLFLYGNGLLSRFLLAFGACVCVVVGLSAVGLAADSQVGPAAVLPSFDVSGFKLGASPTDARMQLRILHAQSIRTLKTFCEPERIERIRRHEMQPSASFLSLTQGGCVSEIYADLSRETAIQLTFREDFRVTPSANKLVQIVYSFRTPTVAERSAAMAKARSKFGPPTSFNVSEAEQSGWSVWVPFRCGRSDEAGGKDPCFQDGPWPRLRMQLGFGNSSLVLFDGKMEDDLAQARKKSEDAVLGSKPSF